MDAKSPKEMQRAGSKMMLAARMVGPGQVDLVERPMPVPGPAQVRIALEGCGVCASNLGPWAGPDWMEFPTESGAPGHEGWGHIDALGSDVTGLKVGERVAFLGQHSYATFDLADARHVVRLPPELDGLPFPGEALGCAMNILARSGIKPGMRVAIIGIGFLGAALTRLAANEGAEVIAIARRDLSLALARQMGAAHTIALEDHWETIEEVRALTEDTLCEVVIEAAGAQWPLDLAGDLVGTHGRLVIAGYHQDGPRQVNMQNWNWRGIDVINAHERDPATCVAGMERAVKAVVARKLDIAPLVTHRFALDHLGAALDATRDKPDGFVKAWVACR
ncbi:MDR/zinc-dependent alcohol dehydrogenase-like family protein [Pseudosulfitobacter koreensis]|uniref:Zinc-binding dehydrogenase n=1 Tax=Pseudosulfitobacter koreensis TaxID=2968472 RepID=A0ABT1YX19_9RHOB|nr:zinc-binding dehydrogenase [Pseudosulfitobacter koreense]MCR8825422.1 zinc-binding dehydrogenase [Pseudosulfitobacter koreense]